MKEGSSRNSVIIENAAQSILDICKEDFSWIEKAMKTLDNEWNGRAAEELFKHYYSLKSKQAKLDKDINDYGITLQKIATSANGIEKTNKQLGDSINSGQENMVGYPPFEQISSIHPTDRQNEQDSHTPNNDVLKTCQIPLDKNGNVINYNPIQFEYGTIETRQGIVSDRGHIRYVTQTCDK